MINNRLYVNDYKKIIASFEKLMYNDSEKMVLRKIQALERMCDRWMKGRN